MLDGMIRPVISGNSLFMSPECFSCGIGASATAFVDALTAHACDAGHPDRASATSPMVKSIGHLFWKYLRLQMAVLPP